MKTDTKNQLLLVSDVFNVVSIFHSKELCLKETLIFISLVFNLVIVSYERMISTSNKCTQKTTLFKKGAFSGDPKGVAPKNFSGGYAHGPPNSSRSALAPPIQLKLALRARAGDCHALGWIRPCM